ncbi:hypothetical protein ES703_47511 [subsurface metagenome]
MLYASVKRGVFPAGMGSGKPFSLPSVHAWFRASLGFSTLLN